MFDIIIKYLPASFSLYVLSLVAYRLLLHPLRKFPGPALAAATLWYQAYWDILKDGGLLEHLEELHKKYGPIVRIGPNELHFSDPRAYSSIYFIGSKFTKDPNFYRAISTDDGSAGLIDPARSKQRREVLSPLFSRRSIFQLENLIQEKVDLLITQLLCREGPLNMYRAFRCATLDIITSYAFARSYDALLSNPFSHPIIVAVETATPKGWHAKHFPILTTLFAHAPDWILRPLNPGLVDARSQMGEQVDQILRDPSVLDSAEHKILYYHLLGRHNPAPKGEKRYAVPGRSALLDEALTIVVAGSDTVANTCSIGTFHVLNNPSIQERLVKELLEAWPDKDSPMGYEALEKLPYLTAVIKESLRLSYGVVSPLPRVVGPKDAEIVGVRVPPGTVVSLGATFVHDDPNVFPDPHRFDPDRWLTDKSKDLDEHLVSFSRGPRSCLGINLAWCELYLILANVFRKLHLQIYETTADDFKFRAYFLPFYRSPPFRAVTTARQS